MTRTSLAPAPSNAGFALPTLAHGSPEPLQNGVHDRSTPSGRTIYLARRGLGILGVTLVAQTALKHRSIFFWRDPSSLHRAIIFRPAPAGYSIRPFIGQPCQRSSVFLRRTETPSGRASYKIALKIGKIKSVMYAEPAGKPPTSAAVCQVDNRRSSKKSLSVSLAAKPCYSA